MPSLKLLVVLQTIYTEGRVTRAAARLHLTQPARSHALKRSIVGRSALVRPGKGVWHVHGELLQDGKQVAIATAKCMVMTGEAGALRESSGSGS